MRLNTNSKNKFKIFLQYLYSPFFVMTILLIVFKMKGIYPFGIVTIDYADMGQINAPIYYHLYDALHGTKSLLFDWYTAFGINMSESISSGSLLSPFNLFFFFVSRENILQSLSIFTMLKLMTMSVCMYSFLRKAFPINIFWKVVFATCYAFSGFVLQYYTNSQWLDLAAIFPLLLLSLYTLCKNNRIASYITMLALCLIINLYGSAMILLFLFFAGGLYIMISDKKDTEKHLVMNFGIGTFSAIGLSAFILLPAYKQTSESVRMASSQTIIKQIINVLNAKDYWNSQKWLMLLGTALVAVIIIKGIIATRKDKRTNILIIGIILIVALPIFFENINLIWHFGSYKGFPLRFGYIISFVLLSSGCYYISKINNLNELNNTTARKPSIIRNIVMIVAGIITVFIIFKALLIAYKSILNNNHYSRLLFVMITLFSILLTGIYAIMLHKSNHFYNYRWISILIASEMLMGAYVFICPPVSIYTSPEQSSAFIPVTNELRKEMDISSSNLDRIKNIGNTLNSNYPFVLQRAAVSNWTHSVTGELQKNLSALGYSTKYTRLMDSGGTVFSDALLNIKQTISTCTLDNDLYTSTAEMQPYYLYDNKYTLPFGITVSSSISSLSKSYVDCFQYQNDFYEQLSGQKELIHPIKNNENLDTSVITQISGETIDAKQEIDYTLYITGHQVLYFYSNGNPNNMSFFVQDKAIRIPSAGQENNTIFPMNFNNKLLCFGAFSNQTINIKIICPSEFSAENIQLGLLDLDKLGTLTKSYEGYHSNVTSTNRGVTLTVTGSNEKNILFLPVSYDSGWSCLINGQKTTVEKVANSFIGVHLQTGENNVQLTFLPGGMKLGSLISFSTLIFLLIGFLIQSKMNFTLSEMFLNVVKFSFCLVWSLAVIVCYVFPVCYVVFYAII